METFKSAIGDRSLDSSQPKTAPIPAAVQKRPSLTPQISPTSTKKTKVSENNSIDDKLKNLPDLPPPQQNVIVDPDQVIKVLQGLESAASKDAAVRSKIASFPKEVTDPSLIHTIRDKATADRVQKMVEDACILLSEYNQKLAQEMENRKTLAVMLSTYIKNQRDNLTASEQSLSEYREKLKKVTKVKNELKNHLQNLPDLRMLPNVAPLPSAGDLFNVGGRSVSQGLGYSKSSSLGSSSSASPSTSSPADYSDSFSTPNI
jgi:dsDNA-binding SOS-regulon protein